MAVALGGKIEQIPGDLGHLITQFRQQSDFLLGGDRSILLSYGTIWLKPFIFKAVSVSDDDIFITISANIGVIFVLASC